MAKPFEYVIEIKGQDAQRFIDDILNPKPNPARDATLRRAREFNIQVIR